MGSPAAYPTVVAQRRHGFVTVSGSTHPYLVTSDVAVVGVGADESWLLRVGHVAGRYRSQTPCANREEALALLASLTPPPVESRGALLDEVEIEARHSPRRPTVVGRYDASRGWSRGPTRDCCDRCGVGIRRVVVIEDCHGRVWHVGTECADKLLRGR